MSNKANEIIEQDYKVVINTSPKGDWLLIPLKIGHNNSSWQDFSKFQGWHILSKGFSPIKLVDAFHSERSLGSVLKVFNNYNNIIIDYGQGLEYYKIENDSIAYYLKLKTKNSKNMPTKDSKTSTYRTSNKLQNIQRQAVNAMKVMKSIIDFDVRFEYDFHEWGRSYKIIRLKPIVLRYEHNNFKVFIALNADNIDNLGWVQKHYWYDYLRLSKNDLWTFRVAVSFRNPLIMSFGFSQQQALNALISKKHELNRKLAKIKLRVTSPDISSNISPNTSLNPKQSIVKAFLSLLIKPDGFRKCFLAGIPWFFYPWSRDELVSLKALMIVGNTSIVKSILTWYLNRLQNGRLQNHLYDKSFASDSSYWLWVRYNDLLTLNPNLLTRKEASRIAFKALSSLELIESLYSSNRLIISKNHETWMDSCFGNDCRNGFCIEIQALHLAGYEFLRNLGITFKNKALVEIANSKIKAMLPIVKKNFYSKSKLLDCLDDSLDTTNVTRPNLFIAYYVFPRLLSKREWEKAFDYALKELWLDWGGLSTISKGSPLYTPNHSGEDNKSYHRGDSWYWINNIAAISMERLNKKKYKSKIEAIKQASLRDFKNWVLGYSSELSSAAKQQSMGCLAQTWSIATLIELLYTLGEF